MIKTILFFRRTGMIVSLPLTLIALYCWWRFVPPLDKDSMHVWLILIGGAFLTLYIWLQNSIKKRYGQPDEEISALSALTAAPNEYLSQGGREKHLRPPVVKELLYDEPTGFCLGTFKGKYVCRSPDTPGAILINGGSGSGKSSAGIIPYLLLQRTTGVMHSLIVDIKRELSDLTFIPGNGIIVDPLDRNSYGIDPFWSLSEGSSSQEIFEVCQTIAISVVPPQSHDKAFWSDSARSMFLGCLLYFYKHKHLCQLTEIIRAILSAPIEDTVNEIVSNARPGSEEYMAIIDYHGMAAETLMGVYSNLKQKIYPLIADHNLAYSLGANPLKYSPQMLLTGDVYLCIPEHKLEQYGQLVFLCLNMFFLWALQLPEKALDPTRCYIGVIIDETVALLSGVGGKLSMLPQALRVLRSKGIMTVLYVQSISGLKSVYSDDEVSDLLSNIPFKLFLDATTPETQKMVSDWCGHYRRKNTSWNGTGKTRSTSVNFSDEPIVRPEDLITLAGTDEAILISSVGGYNRIRKIPYYKEKYFLQLFNDIKSRKEKNNE